MRATQRGTVSSNPIFQTVYYFNSNYSANLSSSDPPWGGRLAIVILAIVVIAIVILAIVILAIVILAIVILAIVILAIVMIAIVIIAIVMGTAGGVQRRVARIRGSPLRGRRHGLC